MRNNRKKKKSLLMVFFRTAAFNGCANSNSNPDGFFRKTHLALWQAGLMGFVIRETEIKHLLCIIVD